MQAAPFNVIRLRPIVALMVQRDADGISEGSAADLRTVEAMPLIQIHIDLKGFVAVAALLLALGVTQFVTGVIIGIAIGAVLLVGWQCVARSLYR